MLFIINLVINLFIKNLQYSFYYLFNFSSNYKFYNLNLPETQEHNFHLLDEQQRFLVMPKDRFAAGAFHAYPNGSSTVIPFLFAVCAFLFCASFVDYLWGGDLYAEIRGNDGNCVWKKLIQNFLVYGICLL